MYILACLQSVDYGRMAEILVQRASTQDPFTRQTAITWVRLACTHFARLCQMAWRVYLHNVDFQSVYDLDFRLMSLSSWGVSNLCLIMLIYLDQYYHAYQTRRRKLEL